MSYQELMSNVDYSEDSYNWSKLRKKYIDEDFPSEHTPEEQEKKQ